MPGQLPVVEKMFRGVLVPCAFKLNFKGIGVYRNDGDPLGAQIESVISIELDLDQELVRKERLDRSFIPEQGKLAAY